MDSKLGKEQRNNVDGQKRRQQVFQNSPGFFSRFQDDARGEHAESLSVYLSVASSQSLDC